MRVLLINPPLDAVLRNGHVSPVTSFLFYNSAPLGLLYIAAVLIEAGHQVDVIDAAAERLDVAGTVRRAEAFRPDVLGLGSTTVGFVSAVELAEALKGALPSIPIVLGGHHVTLLPDDAMVHRCFDVGVLDEGEHTMLELVEHYRGVKALDDIDGLVLRDDAGAIRTTRPRAKFMDLDALPMPARHLIPPELYRPIPIDEHGLPKVAMITSRGCPHHCVFCQKAASGYRSHSVDRIVAEVEHVVRDLGARDLAFVDSLFCVSKKRVWSICDEMIRRRIGISWTCSSRVEVVDQPLLQRMVDAGCWRTRFGIETGSASVLEFISKGITKDTIRRAITAAHEVGLRPKAFFIVGHLVDSRETILESIDFAKSIPLHDITVQINTVLPKTRQSEIFAQHGETYGRIISESTDLTSFWEPTFVPWGLEADDLVELHRRFYREFYLRPQIMRWHLGAIRGPRDVKKYLQAAGLFAFLTADAQLPELPLLTKLVGGGH
jgi:anaerobic magnesium-protoporphyrin IX monomethyl ester cyclase